MEGLPFRVVSTGNPSPQRQVRPNELGAGVRPNELRSTVATAGPDQPTGVGRFATGRYKPGWVGAAFAGFVIWFVTTGVLANLGLGSSGYWLGLAFGTASTRSGVRRVQLALALVGLVGTILGLRVLLSRRSRDLHPR
jgi:hypothetical protein